MAALLKIIRKIKPLWLRFRIDKVFSPFLPGLRNLVNLSVMSKWISDQKKPAFNDFYSAKFDYTKRVSLYKYISEKFIAEQPIKYMEFGVANGHSFKWWVANHTHTESEFHGFDTFEGLPEKWGHFEVGAMSAQGIFPDVVDKRARFYKGLFQNTLPAFIQENAFQKKTVIHLDADLYTSTLYALTRLAPYLKPGDIILFDEFAVPSHEFLAWKNFVDSYYIKYEMIAAANNYFFMAFIIK